MEDREIVNLYLQRNENAINETHIKYGNYCKSIAYNILYNNEDVQECVSDTYFNAWNSIPPHRPQILSVFLGKITRHLSFDKLRHKNANMRGGGEIHLVLDELAECISGAENVEKEIEIKEIVKAINDFLDTISEEKRNVFICRYWYAYPVAEIAKQFGKSENNISVMLNRTRKNLKEYLTERGYEL